jgi:hypothetical protein
MNAPIPERAELELMPDAAKAPDAVTAEVNPASIMEAMQVRESTLAPVMERLVEFWPSSHWGINE